MNLQSAILVGVLAATSSLPAMSPALAATDHGATPRQPATVAAHPLSPLEIEVLMVSAPTITTPADGAEISTNFPEITGTAAPDADVTVYLDGASFGTTTADAEGLWSYVSPLSISDGTYELTATAEDKDTGELSAPSDPVVFTIDTIAPARPAITSPTAGQEVSAPRPTFTGTSEPGATVLVSLDGASVGSTVVADDGSWTFTPTSALLNGSRQLTVRAQDRVGNLGLSRSAVFTVFVPANAPVVSTPEGGTSTTDDSVVIAGTADPECQVTIRLNGVDAAVTAADGTGTWSFAALDMAAGSHIIEAVCVNPSGTVSDVSQPVEFTVEEAATEEPGGATPSPTPPTPPTPPVVDPITPEAPSSEESPSPVLDSEESAAKQDRLAVTGGEAPLAALIGGAFAVAVGGLLAVLARRRKTATQ